MKTSTCVSIYLSLSLIWPELGKTLSKVYWRLVCRLRRPHCDFQMLEVPHAIVPVERLSKAIFHLCRYYVSVPTHQDSIRCFYLCCADAPGFLQIRCVFPSVSAPMSYFMCSRISSSPYYPLSSDSGLCPSDLRNYWPDS